MILFVELLSTVKALLLITILISSVSLASTFRHTINELVAKVENNLVIHFYLIIIYLYTPLICTLSFALRLLNKSRKQIRMFFQECKSKTFDLWPLGHTWTR